MKKYLLIKADTNDADYVFSYHPISDEEIELIRPIASAIKEEFKNPTYSKWDSRHNWETSEFHDKFTPEILYLNTGKLTQEQINLFNKYVPDGNEFCSGIHTIKFITIVEQVEELF